MRLRPRIDGMGIGAPSNRLAARAGVAPEVWNDGAVGPSLKWIPNFRGERDQADL